MNDSAWNDIQDWASEPWLWVGLIALVVLVALLAALALKRKRQHQREQDQRRAEGLRRVATRDQESVVRKDAETRRIEAEAEQARAEADRLESIARERRQEVERERASTTERFQEADRIDPYVDESAHSHTEHSDHTEHHTQPDTQPGSPRHVRR